MNKLDLKSTRERRIIDFQKWNIKNAVALGHYRYKTVFPQLHPHIHPGMMEIVYCVNGEQIYEVNGQLYHVKGGDIFITFPDELHSSAGQPEDRGELYWLIIDVSQPKASFLHFDIEEGPAFCQSLGSLSKRHFKGSATMKKQLETIMLLHASKKLTPMQTIEVKHLLTGFLLELISASNLKSSAADNESLNTIKKIIEDNIHENYSIEQLADFVFLSESRFKSWFKQQAGIPPQEFVLRQKIIHAKKLLEKDDYNIGRIAHELGFSSSQYFSNVFKKFTGFKPTEFKTNEKNAAIPLEGDTSLF